MTSLAGQTLTWEERAESGQIPINANGIHRMEACGCLLVINCACVLPNLSRVLRGQWWNPLGNESGRQEIDDLQGKSDLGKPEINNDKQKLGKDSMANV